MTQTEVEIIYSITKGKVDCLHCGATNEVSFRQKYKEKKPTGKEYASTICWNCGKHVGMTRNSRIQ